jgi:hypothetical protein
MVCLSKILYEDYDTNHKNVRLSMNDLMKHHTKIFDLVENLHDLFCRGSKDYKKALSNV